MKAELKFWRFGIGLFGGWLACSIALFAVAVGYAALTYVIFNPLGRFGKAHIAVGTLHTFAVFAFIYLGYALTLVRRQWRTNALLRLAPSARRVTAALTMRVALIALIAMVPAVMLRALLFQLEFRSGLAATISFADVTLHGYGVSALYLVHVVVLVAITCGPLKVPTHFASLPIMYGAAGVSSATWSLMPLLMCVFLVGVSWFRRWLLADDDTKSRWPKQMGEWSRQRTPWGAARLQRRAAKATGANATSLRVAGLLATRSNVLLTMASVLALIVYMVIKPGFLDSSGLTWFMAYALTAVVAQPSPIPLARVMLLPLGAERRRMGQIIATVWMRDSRIRIALGVSIGLVTHAFCWRLQWPAFLRSPFHVVGDTWTQLLWSPLAHAVGLFGIAMSVSLIASASPKPMEEASFGPTLPITATLVFAVVGLTFKWVLNELIPAIDVPDAGHITFAIVNGAMLPACAWCANRALRYQWATANLSAISAAMHTWSARLQKAFSAS